MMNKKIYIIIIVMSFLLLLGACEPQDTKEAIATANHFLKSLQTADMASLAEIAPWISHVEQSKLTQLIQVMKDIKEWRVGSVNKQGAGVYVSVALSSSGRQQTLLIPLKHQAEQWVVTENIKLSFHLDFVPLK